MKNEILGSSKELFISQNGVNEIIMQPQLKIDSKGIQEDKFYDRDVNRSILITSVLAYDLLKKHNISANYGSLGENLLVNFDPYNVPKGTKISIAEVVLEITNECTICDHLNKINTKVPDLLKNNRGVFAKVIQGGIISINDSIKLLK